MATGATLTTNATNDVFDPEDVGFTMTYQFPATSTNRTFSFLGRISLSSGMGFVTELEGTVVEGVVDFGNTGQFRLVVPDDVSVSSASGIFLSAHPEDADADGIARTSDNCPYHANADQADANGNRRGDGCECGDQDGNGRVNVLDLVAISRAIFEPALATPLCDANGDQHCDVVDIVAANGAIYSPKSSICSRQPLPGP